MQYHFEIILVRNIVPGYQFTVWKSTGVTMNKNMVGSCHNYSLRTVNLGYDKSTTWRLNVTSIQTIGNHMFANDYGV